MNPNLLKLAVLGTDSQPLELHTPSLEPFADALRSSPPKAPLLAAGIETLLDETRQLAPNSARAELARLKTIDRNACMPIEVADEIIKALALYAEAYCVISDNVQETRIFPAESLLRALARFRCKIPPERAAKFIRALALCDAKACDARLALAASVGSAITRDLTKLEVNFNRACRLIPIFLEPYDRPQGVTLDTLAAKLEPGVAINEREDALAALRFLDPKRARDTLEESFKNDKPERRLRLLDAFDVRLELDDAHFLEEIVQKDRSNDVKARAYDLLAKLRETNYAAEIVKVADDIIAKNGEITVPEESPKLKKLGVLTFKTPPQKKSENAKELVACALRRTPLEHWEAVFNASPTQILDKLANQRNFPLVLNGFRASLALFGGPQPWRAPLERAAEAEKDLRKALIWLQDSLTNIAPYDVDGAREAVDEAFLYSKTASQPFQQALALILAVYEPQPWRESFARFFDDVATRALKDIDEETYRALQELSNDFTTDFSTPPVVNARAARDIGRYVADLIAPVYPQITKPLQFKYYLILSAVKRESYYFYDYVYNNPHPFFTEIKHGKGFKQIAESDSLIGSYDIIRRYFASLEEAIGRETSD